VIYGTTLFPEEPVFPRAVMQDGQNKNTFCSPYETEQDLPGF